MYRTYILFLFSIFFFFFFKQKTAYEMRISDWSSDVCSSDLDLVGNDADAEPFRLFDEGFELIRRKHGARGVAGARHHGGLKAAEIGRASCRERVCQYV